MKILLGKLIDVLAEAAVLEEGIRPDRMRDVLCDPFKESFEENLMEVAFAEAADYDDIHAAILREHQVRCAAA